MFLGAENRSVQGERKEGEEAGKSTLFFVS